MNFFIDDIIRRLVEMKESGYSYCEISLEEADEEIPAQMLLSALECGGDGAVDFDEIDEVPLEEIEKYADCNVVPPHSRKPIKRIKIMD